MVPHLSPFGRLPCHLWCGYSTSFLCGSFPFLSSQFFPLKALPLLYFFMLAHKSFTSPSEIPLPLLHHFSPISLSSHPSMTPSTRVSPPTKSQTQMPSIPKIYLVCHWIGAVVLLHQPCLRSKTWICTCGLCLSMVIFYHYLIDRLSMMHGGLMPKIHTLHISSLGSHRPCSSYGNGNFSGGGDSSLFCLELEVGVFVCCGLLLFWASYFGILGWVLFCHGTISGS
ncbi:unnamed protein product, partial [Prunus brigantina]